MQYILLPVQVGEPSDDRMAKTIKFCCLNPILVQPAVESRERWALHWGTGWMVCVPLGMPDRRGPKLRGWGWRRCFAIAHDGLLISREDLFCARGARAWAGHVLWMYKKPVPSKGWMVTKGLLRLNASVGLSARNRLRTVGSPQWADSVLRYLSLKASLLVNLTEITVWVLWRQVSRSVGFYSREVRNKKTNKKRTL